MNKVTMAAGQAIENGRLFLARIGADFDPKKDIACGPWCFIGKEDVVTDWDQLDFVTAFETPRELKTAERQTEQLFKIKVLEWGEKLNAKFGRSYSSVFWHRILMLWLSSAIQSAWARWRHFEKVVERYGEVSLSVPNATGDPSWSFEDFSDFNAHLNGDKNFCFWMNSQILQNMSPGSWSNIDVPLDLTGTVAKLHTPQNRNTRLSHLKTIARKFMPRLAVDDLIGVSWEKAWLSVVVSMFPRKRPPEKTITPVDRVPPDVFSEKFLAFLDFFLNATRPASYGSAFIERIDAAAKTRFFPGRLFVTNTYTLDEERRFVCALALEAGEKLIDPQHGGNQGLAATHPWTGTSSEFCFATMTWGWTQHQGFPGHYIPYSAPLLANVTGRHKAQNPDVIFVGTQINLNGIRYDSIPNPVQALEYRRMKVRFLERLPVSIKNDIKYRPYNRGFSTLSDQAYLDNKVPGLNYLGGELTPELLRCRLLVLDHSGTTLAVAIAANVPTICFWNPAAWPYTEAGEKLLSDLKDCKVYHESPEAAADHIEEIWGDIAGWWRKPDVVKAVANWRNHYARASSGWRIELLKTLHQISTAKLPS